MHIIAGLGNPGKKFEKTRHNIGFMVVDELARMLNLEWKEEKKLKSLIARQADLILVKPQVFMNESGASIGPLMRYYQLLPKSLFGTKKDSDLSAILTVVHDELDLPFGNYKFSTNSRPAGHNGIKSLVAHLKTQNFRRLRVGIGTENRRQIPTAAFVLQPFSSDELRELETLIPEIAAELSDFEK